MGHRDPGGLGMGKLVVYFVNNCKVEFDKENVAFNGDGIVFDFLPFDRPEEEKMYSALVENGRALVNWKNVCYVKEKPEDPGDE